MKNCINCNEPVTGNYCSNCGQPVMLKRIDRHYIIHEIGDYLLANKGLVYTIKKVLISPGKSVRRFLAEDRYRFVKPITFLFLTSLFYTLVCYLFHIGAEDFYLQSFPEELELPTFKLIMNWMLSYSGYTGILSGFFIAVWVKLFFRKTGYNIFEIFILICFVSGISSLFGSALVIVQSVAHVNLLYVSALISIIYYAWAIGQFLDGKKYIKAFFTCIFGYYLFGILIAFTAIFIDLIIKN